MNKKVHRTGWLIHSNGYKSKINKCGLLSYNPIMTYDWKKVTCKCCLRLR